MFAKTKPIYEGIFLNKNSDNLKISKFAQFLKKNELESPKKKNSLFYLLLICLACNACLSTKKWQENQFLLHKQSIRGVKNVQYYDLEGLYRQKPNRRIFFLTPYVGIYNFGKSLYKPEKINKKMLLVDEKYKRRIAEAERELDNSEKRRMTEKKIQRFNEKREKKINKYKKTIEEGSWLMRTVGEKPVFFDSLKAAETASEMKKYLNNKGYFHSRVGFATTKLKNKRINAQYLVEENEPSFFGSYEFETDNREIDSLMNAHKQESKIKTGENYDAEKISAEQQRIETLLRNKGFLYFNRQYVEFLVDTLHFVKKEKITDSTGKTKENVHYDSERKLSIKAVINNPNNQKHRSFIVEDIYFHITNPGKFKGKKDTLQSKFSQINYVYDGKRLNYSYRTLDRKVRFPVKEKYDHSKVLDTQRSIGLLDMFKFVNINPDTSRGKLKVNLFTTPLERYQISDEIGLNVVQGLPGPFINISLKNRNTFGGAQIFENSARFQIDGQTGFAQEAQFYSSQEIFLNSSLTFPKLLFPRKLFYRRLRNNIETFNPTTKLNLGYIYTRRPEYTRTNLNASITYKGQLQFSTYNFTLAELSIVNTTRLDSVFNQLLDDLQNRGNPIRQSFSRALVSSMYFVYTFNNNAGNEAKPTHYIRFLVEVGGLTMGLLRQTPLFSEDKLLGLNVYQYWRVNPTFHYYLPVNPYHHAVAIRLNMGIARPFGRSGILPYEKFYFSGGGISMRAWQPRRLGPGEYAPLDSTGNFDYRFEQPGEIVLEGNLEYRFPIISFLRGALFLDAGNVWTFNEEANRPGGQFKWNSFLGQLALGTGFGIRFNLPFLVLRFDLGIRLYDPARNRGERWVIGEFNPLKPFRKGLTLLNIGIGYPF